jgi:hypothetical protein
LRGRVFGEGDSLLEGSGFAAGGEEEEGGREA